METIVTTLQTDIRVGDLVEASFLPFARQSFVFIENFSRCFRASDHLVEFKAIDESAPSLVVPYLPAFGLQTFHADDIVDGSFLRVCENVVGFLHLNEQIHRQLFVSRVGVFVGMVDES